MGFNTARFNLTKFNRKGSRVRWVRSAVGKETVTASIGSAQNNYFLGILYERVNGSVKGAMGKMVNAKFAETVAQIDKGEIRVYIMPAASETIGVSNVCGANIFERPDLSEQIAIDTYGELRRMLSANISENITPTLTAGSDAWLEKDVAEVVNASIKPPWSWLLLEPVATETVRENVVRSAVLMLTANGTETISENIVLSAFTHLVCNISELLVPAVVLGATIYDDGHSYELISSSASVENIEEKVCVLNITLKPGDRLTIDADNYIILKNNENAIDTHSGDWIDELDRDTTNIDISAASGASNLSATILYTERYL